MRWLLLTTFFMVTGCQEATGGNPDATAGTDITPDVVGQLCEANADCSDAVCERASQRCVACRVAADCGRGGTCAAGQCTAATTCGSDLDCTSAGQVCGPSSECVRCAVAADCGPGKGCVQGACVVANACDSSLDCTATHQVCGAVLAPEWPEAVTRACKDCDGDADCGAGDRCDDGLCIAVCRAAGAVCGDIDQADGTSIACGACAGYCSGKQRVCASTTPIDVELRPSVFADGGEHFYGVDSRVRERVLVGDKRTNTIATLFELPIGVKPGSSDEPLNAVVAAEIAADDPGTLYVLTDHRTLWQVPLANPAARTTLLEPTSDIEACFWLAVVGRLYAGGCFTGAFFGSLDGGGTAKNTDVTYAGAIVGQRLFVTQSNTLNELSRAGLLTELYSTPLAISGLVAHDGWLYFSVSESPPSLALHRMRVPAGGGELGQAERLGGKLLRIISVSPVGFFGRVCDGECSYALIDPVTLRPSLLGDNFDWGRSTHTPVGIYRDAGGTLRMILGQELLGFPY